MKFLERGRQVEFDRPALLPAHFEALRGFAFDGFSDFARGFGFALDGTSELAERQGVTIRCAFFQFQHQAKVIRQGMFREGRVAVTDRAFLRAAPRVAAFPRHEALAGNAPRLFGRCFRVVLNAQTPTFKRRSSPD
jgi:hypothetical protein